jgi:hypothetical protein
VKRFAVVPMELEDANLFVATHHRHADPVRGHKFSQGLVLVETAQIVGVAITGRPIQKTLDDGWTLEVTRNCTDGTKDAASALYGAAMRATFALGFTRLITYTGKHETGSSLRAAGFKVVGEVRGRRSWGCQARPRVKTYPLIDKLRWEARA